MLTNPELLEKSTQVASGVLSPNIIWIFFALAFVGFVVYTAILLYHWFHYASETPMMWPVMIVYLVISVILLFILFFSALAIST